ncbi:DUF1206 domain-containing protein [Nocardioides pantholopis]|uniref:DUF1206 domain-containing protein n=1 Tax=Nocardioides pantholopis TaxID=2483798 RepID=UPI000F0834F4|nr:DUF1206 domain-containing protein [Nocardioides pantholopis]
MASLSDRAERLGHEANSSTWLDLGIRGGLVAYGVVHLLIAWLALQLAFGEREGEASNSGAMQQLAEQPFGTVLLWLVALGMLLLVAWRVLEALVANSEEDGADRAKKMVGSLGKAAIYAAIGVSAVRVAVGSGGGGKSGSDTMTAQVMGWPGGQFLVGAVGLGVVGYGLHHLWRAWTDEYREQLDGEGQSGSTGTAYLWFGKIGYAAKGLAVAIVGSLFVYAAATHDPKKSGGLDEALREVLEKPFGPVLLGAIALGIACFGLFSFARARHLSR